jgi:hypothetical protein
MATDASPQLSFNVGGELPTETIIRVTGGMFTTRELRKGEEIHVQVVDTDGETVANGYGQVETVGFRDVYQKVDGERVLDHTERVHGAKVT